MLLKENKQWGIHRWQASIGQDAECVTTLPGKIQKLKIEGPKESIDMV